MKPEPTHPRSNRRVPALPWTAALLVLLFAGSGAALADDRRGGRDGYRHHDRYENHRGHRGYHRGQCNDHRYDRHRQRYDRSDRRHYDDHRRYDRYRYNRYRYDRYRHRHFDVPRVILHDLHHTYRPYRHGRRYHAKHRHYHEVYRFPVYSAYGVEYYPYAYCEGNFFGRGIFRNGRAIFDLRISF